MAADDVLSILRLSRVVRGADLLRLLQRKRPTMSRATMMRMLKSLGDQVVVGGAARSTSYGLRRSIRGNRESLLIYYIDMQGVGTQVATLEPIYPAGCLLKVNVALEWPLTKEMQDGWFPGLPYMLDDMRPQGFIGRNFAHNYAALFSVPEDPTKWSEDDVLAVLMILGSDTLGNLILGEAAYRRHLLKMQEGYKPIADEDIARVYTEEAELALAHGVANSSAGGEFPKFTRCRFKDGIAKHVLVKFSGNEQSASVQRWSDLLVCEHLALQIINDQLPLAAARSQIIQSTQRTFLEVERFDRHGEFGRSAVCTWAAIEAAMFGIAGASWIVGGKRLLKEGFISTETLREISILWYFGKLIANTDMHEGNLAFQPTSPNMFSLAPAYDMLPMLYAPLRGVELPNRKFQPELPMPSDREEWMLAAKAAEVFWMSAASDQRISASFREICSENHPLVTLAINKV